MHRLTTPFLALLLLGGPVFAQEDRRGQRENAELRAHVKILAAKLEALERVVVSQELEMAELRARTRRSRPRDRARDRPRDRPRAREGRAARRGPLTRAKLREHYEHARERHGQKHEVVRDLGALLEVLGEDMNANWLRKKHKQAAKRLGKEHPEVREMAGLLELLQDDVQSGKLEQAIQRWRRIREQLERLERAGRKRSAKERERGIEERLRHVAELREAFEEAKAHHGAGHAKTRERANAFERAYGSLKRTMINEGELRLKESSREVKKKLAQYKERLAYQSKDVQAQLLKSARRVEQVAVELGKDHPTVRKLREKHNDLYSSLEHLVEQSKSKYAAFEKKARRKLDQRKRTTRQEIERTLERTLKGERRQHDRPDRDRPRRERPRREGSKLY